MQVLCVLIYGGIVGAAIAIVGIFLPFCNYLAKDIKNLDAAGVIKTVNALFIIVILFGFTGFIFPISIPFLLFMSSKNRK
jgi:hypothetical protein